MFPFDENVGLYEFALSGSVYNDNLFGLFIAAK